MFSIGALILAILALSFLIFIHELGHYFMARRVGMRVEVFSIGFGRPVVSWIWDGVKWQIGWLPFGGYVKIAGTDTDKNVDPYLVKDGFFGKGPWARIKVAFMGPLVNLVFALFAFTLIWMGGGREKNFVEYTHKIGWVDPNSELFRKGIRPGDEIAAYNGVEYEGIKDHIYQPLVSQDLTEISGFRVNYATKDKTPFNVKVKSYPHPNSLTKGIVTSGILAPASFIRYDKLPGGKENPISEGLPLAKSGIEYGDRLVWVNGHLVFSVQGLSELINDNRVLLTVQRGDQTLLARVPVVESQEFKLDDFRDELSDWQYESDLNDVKMPSLKILPYNLTNEGVVENALSLIDPEKTDEIYPETSFSYLEAPLQVRDKILAVNGEPVKYSYEILKKIQTPKALVIVKRDSEAPITPSQADADILFDEGLELKALDKIVKSLGTAKPVKSSGDYVLLNEIPLVKRKDIQLEPEKEALAKTELKERKRLAESIEDPDEREQAVMALENRQNEYVIGLPAIQDQKVVYNPGPFKQFSLVLGEIGQTLEALFTGALNPKWLSGPVGIVRVVQNQAMMSMMEVLFWLGAISLNLGVLNLLPIPMLDGGTILFSFFELLSGKKIKPKTLEKMILPFAVLLILFFIFVTYHDVARIFEGIFK